MGLRTTRTRIALALVFTLALAFAQFRDAGLAALAAHLEIVTVDAATGNAVPACIYLDKGGRPFRLTPVEALLPLAPDVFYRDRVWRASPKPRTLEVTCKGRSHRNVEAGARRRGRIRLRELGGRNSPRGSGGFQRTAA